MSNAQEAVKTRHKETSLIFPVLALVVLFLWGSSQTLPVVIAINLLALIGILSSAFSVVRHADVLAHRLGEPYGSLILSLSVVILEVSLISALMATGDAAPTLMRDTLYSIIMIVTGGLVGFSLLLGGPVFNCAVPPGDNRTGISNGSACGEFFNRSGVTGSINFCGNVWRIFADPDQNASNSVWHAIWLIIHLIAVIAVTKNECQPAGDIARQHECPCRLYWLPGGSVDSVAGRFRCVKSSVEQPGPARDESVLWFSVSNHFAYRTCRHANCLYDG
uniref:Sodium/calcium exchanger membrane region domain-containing protein n=1 Tax=Panagrolaimus superbus TaxID=310955 RepID=A0A914Y919_9BILA